MNAVFAIAWADLLERTRTFAILIVIAGLLQFGFLLVPDRSAGYSTLDFGGWRGVYDSAWMGVSTALLTVSFLPLIGFFLIRPSQSRDATLGTYDLVAAAPLSRRLVVLGKWSSNVALLICFAVLLTIAGIAMQLVRGEDRTVDPFAYLWPLLVVTVPACAVSASFALAITAVPGLRGIGGGVAWFFIWTALLAVPLQSAGTHAVPFDPLGITTLTSALFDGIATAVPGANRAHDLSIGVSDAARYVFRYPGVGWSAASVATRAGWLLVAIAIAIAVSPFALIDNETRSRGRFADLPLRLAARLPLPPLIRAELSAALGNAGAPWLVGMGTLTLAALAVPSEGLARVVAPLVWIWPLGPVSFATVMDVRAHCEDVLRATPTPSLRRALARTTACFLLAMLPVAALALRDGFAGIALLALAMTAAAVAVATGALARSPLPFECAALAVWYLGAVNRFPPLDPANAAARPLQTVIACAGASGAALALTAWRLR